MTTPATLDLAVWRNVGMPPEEWEISEAGSALDLTGWTAALQVRLYGLAGGDPLIDLGTVLTDIEGVRFSDAANGVITVRIDAATLEALPASGKAGEPATFRYDLVMTDDEGTEAVFLQGAFKVYPGITR